MENKHSCPALCKCIYSICSHCYSSECCSIFPGLLFSSPSVLGTIQLLIGVVNIGLGPGRTSTHPGDLTQLGAPYWLGAVYIAAGILCILAGQFPSAILVGFTVFMNLASAIFAITGIVLYAIDLNDASLYEICNPRSYDYDYVGHYDNFGRLTAAQMRDSIPGRLKQNYDSNCKLLALIADRLLTNIDILLIILAVLQLCVNISTAVLGIKALIGPYDTEEGFHDDEFRKPLLNKISTINAPA